MKKKVNIVQIEGFLGAKPEFHQFESGKSMARASLAFNESYKKDGEQVEKTNWFPLIFWNELAEKREKIQERLKENNITINRRTSLLPDLNFISMYFGQETERIGYALGHLTLNDISEEWYPSGFHISKGIKEELKSLTF